MHLLFSLIIIIFSKNVPSLKKKLMLRCDHHTLKDEQGQHHKAFHPSTAHPQIHIGGVWLSAATASHPADLPHLHHPHQLCIQKERGQKLHTAKLLFLFDFPLLLSPQSSYNRCKTTTGLSYKANSASHTKQTPKHGCS